jgi:hypothetical protein
MRAPGCLKRTGFWMDARAGSRGVIRSLFMRNGDLEERNLLLQKKYALIKKKEVLSDSYDMRALNWSSLPLAYRQR